VTAETPARLHRRCASGEAGTRRCAASSERIRSRHAVPSPSGASTHPAVGAFARDARRRRHPRDAATLAGREHGAARRRAAGRPPSRRPAAASSSGGGRSALRAGDARVRVSDPQLASATTGSAAAARPAAGDRELDHGAPAVAGVSCGSRTTAPRSCSRRRSWRRGGRRRGRAGAARRVRLSSGPDAPEPDDAWWFWEKSSSGRADRQPPIISRPVTGRLKLLGDGCWGRTTGRPRPSASGRVADPAATGGAVPGSTRACSSRASAGSSPSRLARVALEDAGAARPAHADLLDARRDRRPVVLEGGTRARSCSTTPRSRAAAQLGRTWRDRSAARSGTSSIWASGAVPAVSPRRGLLRGTQVQCADLRRAWRADGRRRARSRSASARRAAGPR